jgi:PAS domain S-box-containing protein
MMPDGQGSAEIERLRTRVQVLTDAMRAFIADTIDLPRLLQTVARKAAEQIHDYCAVLVLSADETQLELAALYDEDRTVATDLAAFIRRRPIVVAKNPITAQVLLQSEPFLAPRYAIEDARSRTTPEHFAYLQQLGLHSVLVVQLRAGGKPLGTLSFGRFRSDRPPFDELDVELAQALADQAGIAILNARLLKESADALAERRRAEDQTRARTFLDAIVENMPAMVFVKESERLSFELFNRAGEQLLGVDRKDLLGKNDYDFFPPDQAAFFQAKDRETLERNLLVDIPEEPIETARGRRWLHTKKVPILDDAGTPRFLLGISLDITDRKNADAALRAAKDATEEANRELEAFSYSVAHDLRAPLRAIDGFSQALLEDYGDALDDEGRRSLAFVRQGAMRMAELIDDLLTLSRVTRAGLDRSKVDLSALVRASFRRLSLADADRRVALEIQDGLEAEGDPRLLAIAVDNLCENAWKFTRGASDARIVFRANGSRGYSLEDNGVGFDMRHASKLFGVFQRLHGVGDFEGTGIGLATVQRIVQRHGGRIWAEGEVGRGATFTFTLSPETP